MENVIPDITPTQMPQPKKKTSTLVYILGAAIVVGLGAFIYFEFFNKKGKSLGLSKVNSNNPSNFLFIGDSLTIGGGNISFADKIKTAYPNISIKKIAVVGMKTDWMLQQLQTELTTGNKYDVITIWGGVNDIYALNEITDPENNLQKMYGLIKGVDAKVIALTIVPTATYTLQTRQKIMLTNTLNSWIKSNKSVDVVVDVNSLVNNGSDGTKPEYLLSDTLHLTDAAHEIIAQDFEKRVIK